MENRILKLCLDVLEKGNETVDCGAIRCNCCPFNGENDCLARIEHRVEGRAIAETYIKKHTSEERHSTGKTFREVIADIKEGEVWESEYREIYITNLGGFLISNKNGTKSDCYLFPLTEIFKLQRKKYTFEEAFKAYEKGKEIESCVSGAKFTAIDSEHFQVILDGSQSIKDTFEVKEICGMWYINN